MKASRAHHESSQASCTSPCNTSELPGIWTYNKGQNQTEPLQLWTACLTAPLPKSPSLHKSQGQDWQCHESTQKVAEMLLPTPWAWHPCGRASHAAAHMRYLASAAFGERSITKMMFVYSMRDNRGAAIPLVGTIFQKDHA